MYNLIFPYISLSNGEKFVFYGILVLIPRSHPLWQFCEQFCLGGSFLLQKQHHLKSLFANRLSHYGLWFSSPALQRSLKQCVWDKMSHPMPTIIDSSTNAWPCFQKSWKLCIKEKAPHPTPTISIRGSSTSVWYWSQQSCKLTIQARVPTQRHNRHKCLTSLP